MKSLMDRIRKLCTPAYVYLVISVIALVLMGFQNVGNSTEYCAGSYSCAVNSTILVFVVKILYVIFWTWILNLICKAGAPIVSWVLVLLPFVLMFLLIAIYMMGGSRFIPSTMHGII
jgi:hypothetical protein